jgi:uridine kinase
MRTARRGGGSPDVEAESNRRYVEGQKLYLAECDPQSLATFVVDNNDFQNPSLRGV